MINPYEEEFRTRATGPNPFWVLQEGAGERWEVARKKYSLTASTLAGLWNGAGYERTANLLARLEDGKERVFNAYTLSMMEEGKKHEADVIKTLTEHLWGAATWQLSPGIFEFELAGETIGASPDGIVWFGRHQIPIEVKWHARGECKWPMPCGYFAQLYTQMMATRATLGIYLGMAPSGEMCVTVLARSYSTDRAFEDRVLWFREERKRWASGTRRRFPEVVDAIDALRINCTIFQQRDPSKLLRFLRERTKHDDNTGVVDLFDLERNAVPPTRPNTPRPRAPGSPGALPLPSRYPSSPRLVGGRSRSSSPRTRRLPQGDVGPSLVAGNAEVEGAT